LICAQLYAVLFCAVTKDSDTVLLQLAIWSCFVSVHFWPTI